MLIWFTLFVQYFKIKISTFRKIWCFNDLLYILLIDVALFVFPCTRLLMVMFRMPVWGLQPKERLCNFLCMPRNQLKQLFITVEYLSTVK